MTFNFTVYGDVRFDLSYNEVELREFILSYIKTRKETASFTYLKLCKALIDKAISEGRLEGAKSNTYYQSPQLKPSQYTKISKLLWDFIREGIIFIDFYNNEYVSQIPHDTTFGINVDAI